ncbi:hypothetical protein PENSPDRAFT_671327 [Peniophora sp. CONT]|nr:hypothetical protein PENSPDRAFT_671327 [Peniophora sp. CONT]
MSASRRRAVSAQGIRTRDHKRSRCLYPWSSRPVTTLTPREILAKGHTRRQATPIYGLRSIARTRRIQQPGTLPTERPPHERMCSRPLRRCYIDSPEYKKQNATMNYKRWQDSDSVLYVLVRWRHYQRRLSAAPTIVALIKIEYVKGHRHGQAVFKYMPFVLLLPNDNALQPSSHLFETKKSFLGYMPIRPADPTYPSLLARAGQQAALLACDDWGDRSGQHMPWYLNLMPNVHHLIQGYTICLFMPVSFSDAPPPRVAVSLARDEGLRKLIEPIWRAAQDDPEAYPRLRAGLEEGLIENIYHHHDLARHVLAIQPAGVQARSIFVHPSGAMLASFILFFCASVSATVVFLRGAFARPPSATAYKHISPIISAIRIALLQHFQPTDPYTLEVLDGLWRLACRHPSALDEHGPDTMPFDGRVGYTLPQHKHHRELAWVISKLRRSSVHRVPRSGASPVKDAPFEVLQCIFMHLRWTRPYFENVDEGRWNRCSHLSLLTVCRTWHEVICQTPSLWTPLTLDFGPRMSTRALELSKEELLYVRCDLRTHWNEPYSLVLQHLRRIHFMDILTESLDISERLPLLLRASKAPKMSHFQFWPFLNFEGHRRVVLHEDIFDSTSPENLHTVDLGDCTVIMPSPLFSPALVTLRLIRCDVWEDLDALINTLSSLPALRDFMWNMSASALANVNSPVRLQSANFLTSARQPIAFPRMRTLDLECPMACAAALMHYIVVPPSCEVNLADDYTLTGERLHDLSVEDGLIASLTASIGDHLARVFTQSDVGYDVISISEHPEADAQKGALFIECRRADRMYPDCTIALFVSSEHEDGLDDDVLSYVLRGILQWPGMSAATRLETNHEGFSSAPLWTIVLRCLPRVRHIYLDNSAESDASGSILGLGHALYDTLDIVPALAHVQLQCLSFPPLPQQRLAEAVGRRHAAGSPVITLYVEECSDVGPDGGLEGIFRVHAEGALNLELLPSYSYLGPRELLE